VKSLGQRGGHGDYPLGAIEWLRPLDSLRGKCGRAARYENNNKRQSHSVQFCVA